jgi:hypothetical protein
MLVQEVERLSDVLSEQGEEKKILENVNQDFGRQI